MPRWTHLKLRTKILALFVLLTAIPLGIQSLLTFHNFSSTIREQAVGYTGQIIRQMNMSLQQTLQDDMQKFSLLALYNNELLSILDKYAAMPFASILPTEEERSTMFQYIAGYEFSKTYISGVRIITNHGYIFTNTDPYYIRSFIQLEPEPWFERVRAAKGRWIIIPRHTPSYIFGREEESIVSMASLILDPSSAEVMGIIKIDFSDDLFLQLSSNYQNTEIGSLFILNRDNEMLFEQNNGESDANLIHSVLQADLPNTNDAFIMTFGGKQYLTTVSYSRFTGLKIISLNPVSSLMQLVAPLRTSTFLLALVCLFFAVVLATLMSYKLTSPLSQLQRKMMLVRKGNLKQSVPVASHDELGQLSHSFNMMTHEMDRLVNEVYLISLKEKEAQLSALQSQINPHFIYNTLESINMMAIQAHNYEVSDTVHALGQFLRYTVDKYDRVVTLKEEIESVQAYIKIQNIRFRSRLRVIFDVDDSLYKQRVPKLLLQPLVENAILHGFRDMQNEGTIWISIQRFEDMLLMTVRDDGKGLSDSEIDHLRIMLKRDPLEGSGNEHGIALSNINQRLQLMYGSSFGIDIDGAPGQGAAFTITIPIDEEDNHEDFTR